MSNPNLEAAFPIMPPVDDTGRSAVGYPWPEPGMSLRDFFAAHAPITSQDAIECYGKAPNMYRDVERAAFLAVWTFLRYEYADAMLNARLDRDKTKAET